MNDSWRRLLTEAIDRALDGKGFRLVAFVYMPEHVHLLVYPVDADSRVETLLSAIKRPFSYRVKQQLIAERNPLLADLTVQERPGKRSFRFWVEGGGYDRNLTSAASVMASIDYLHLNPVKRGLCRMAIDWKWSSARFFASDGKFPDPDLPTLSPLPPSFLT
jgi:putative transposase